MTFKEVLQASILEERVANIESDINRNRSVGLRHLNIPMIAGVDIVPYCLLWYKLLPSGQAIWDKCVSLGFEPDFTWCVGITIRW